MVGVLIAGAVVTVGRLWGLAALEEDSTLFVLCLKSIPTQWLSHPPAVFCFSFFSCQVIGPHD